MKRVSIACAIALGLVLGSGGAAMAGEVNGNGDDTPIAGHDTAASICAFSGLDTPDSIENPDHLPGPENNDDFFAIRGSQKKGYHGVQNYGAVVKAGLKAFAPSPGVACRGNG
jgi:hypothetical protein